MFALWRDLEFCLLCRDKILEIDTLEKQLEKLSTCSTLEYVWELLIDDTIVEFSDDLCWTDHLEEIFEFVVLSIELIELAHMHSLEFVEFFFRDFLRLELECELIHRILEIFLYIYLLVFVRILELSNSLLSLVLVHISDDI